ncbi:GNAT family N-acetyltransferase [Flavobacteriaceae bacterium]|nr:GNAT family N-acetyltransferase [Flavobacteriaceae bacterium]
MIVEQILKEETHPLRKRILRKGISLPYVFQGDSDQGSLHYGLKNGEEVLGVVSFVPQGMNELPSKQIQLRGMAIDEKLQGRGYGSLLLQDVLSKLQDLGYEFVWCNARERAYSFYENNGFKREGNEFEVDQIGTHDRMWVKIA